MTTDNPNGLTTDDIKKLQQIKDTFADRGTPAEDGDA